LRAGLQTAGAFFRRALTAILGEETKEVVHDLKLSRVNRGAAFAPHRDILVKDAIAD
jgi:hypothetical protein